MTILKIDSHSYRVSDVLAFFAIAYHSVLNCFSKHKIQVRKVGHYVR